jgi:uncharacterized protein YeaO (DUF488 family)
VPQHVRLAARRCENRVVAAHDVKVARVYDRPLDGSGARILVDRLWPRGLSKQSARLDEWCKDVAPSPRLREWYGHDPDKFDEFARRYRAELKDLEHEDVVEHLRDLAKHQTITLLTATKNPAISGAAVLAELIRR